jgi:hypothetical protein
MRIRILCDLLDGHTLSLIFIAEKVLKKTTYSTDDMSANHMTINEKRQLVRNEIIVIQRELAGVAEQLRVTTSPHEMRISAQLKKWATRFNVATECITKEPAGIDPSATGQQQQSAKVNGTCIGQKAASN